MLRVVFAATLGALLLPSSRVLADAVPPPPDDCPAGQVGTTSHGGPACMLEAPKNCAPGYRGEVGGSCVLAACSTDQECQTGNRCLQVDACQELRELNWTGWGWSAQRRVVPNNFFAEPPAPAPAGEPPKAWVKLRICGQDGACTAPAECRPMGLCYPPNAVGKTKAKVVSAAPVAETLPDGVYSQSLIAPDSRTGSEREANHDQGGGSCRKGCAVGSTSQVAGWLLVPLLVAAGSWRRRATRNEARRPVA